MTLSRWLLLTALLTWTVGQAAAEPPSVPLQAAECEVPDELADPGASLPHVAKALREGQLRLLVLGTASGLGAGNSSPEAAWPHRMSAALESRVPGLKVQLDIRSQRGSTTEEQKTILVAALREAPPNLVLWQTGTVEAVRNTDPQEMATALESGIAAAHAATADVVLIDQQFSRFLRANAQVDTYRDVMRLAALASGVPLLQRYELMRLWAENERLDIEHAPRSRYRAVTDRLHDCLGQALAQLVLRAVR
ncbi:MAG TPA: SGNH/GDSL hydrolase family protein [Roseomonas sp.]|nr:SGNH/GDSL hydrolase family protein [Roseomonas sp.]